MSTPLFSITIPTLNRSHLLRDAVHSILSQTFHDLEIVVSDNSSTDDTADLVRTFTDPRVRYVRTPRRLIAVDSFEHALRNAHGSLVIVMNDDDALVPTALERFAAEHRTTGADFLFCKTAEYFDRGFPGPRRNTLKCPAFSGASRPISADDFIGPWFAWKPTFNMHPTAYAVARKLADRVTTRLGRFFHSKGVEYCAWPLATTFATRIAHLELPLAICGRTGKSWGVAMSLGRARKRRMEQFVEEYYQDRQYKHVPLRNFTQLNAMAEGLLTAKALCPKEFAAYELNEPRYLRATMNELIGRQKMGVDVSADLEELRQYLTSRHPELAADLLKYDHAAARDRASNLWRRMRGALGDAGVRGIRDRLLLRRQARARTREGRASVLAGQVDKGFEVQGSDFGFHDILGCARFLERIITQSTARTVSSTDR